MTGTNFNQSSNLIIGDDAAELLRLGSVGIVAGFGGNDTIEGVVNGVAPGSTLFGGQGNDFLISKGIGDEAYGGMGNDVLVNESGRATQYGDDGNDTILGEEDQNTVYGGAGNDSVYVTEDRNVVFGEAGNDTIRGGEGNDIFAGGAGNDYLIASQAANNPPSFLFGNAGNDTLKAGPNSDSLYGGMGDDSVCAGTNANSNNMFLSGDKGNDSITYLGSGESVILDGDRSASLDSAGTDAGNDYFTVGAGAKSLDVFGGAGNDTINSFGSQLGAEAQVFMGQGNDYLAVVSGGNSSFSGDLGNDFGSIVAASNDTILGDPASIGSDASAGNDTLLVTPNGTSGASVIYGDDTANGAAGNDSIVLGAGAGSAIAFGGAGNDFLDGSANPGADTLVGGAGNDFYRFGAGDVIPFDSLGNNTYVAGTGAGGASPTDTVTVSANDSFTGGATFLVTGEAELIKTLTDGGVIASDEKDLITIGTANALTSLAGGDDTLNATNLTSSGSVFGGAGNDRLVVSGTDASGLVDGGAGNDSVAFTNPDANVTTTVNGGAGDDTLAVAGIFSGSASLGDGNDAIDIGTLGAGAIIDGGAGNESIVIPAVGTSATSANATLSGGAGDDTIAFGSDSATGTGVDAVIDGGDGNDFLVGKVYGGDSIIGGAGNDTLFGGFGGATQGSNAEFMGGDTLTGGAGADVFVLGSIGKTGFIVDLGVAGTNSPGPYVFFDGTSAAASQGGTFNAIQNVDVITDFNPAEDVLLLNSDFWVNIQRGTTSAEITNAASGFESGSINYLADGVVTGGVLRGGADPIDGATPLGTNVAVSLIGTLGIGAGIDFQSAGTAGGEINGEINGVDFTYDTNTGGLYFQGGLVAIFTGTTIPALTANNIQALPSDPASGILTP